MKIKGIEIGCAWFKWNARVGIFRTYYDGEILAINTKLFNIMVRW